MRKVEFWFILVVNIARGDYLGAGLDLLGAIPFVGEVADGVKYARYADSAIGLMKTATDYLTPHSLNPLDNHSIDSVIEELDERERYVNEFRRKVKEMFK